MYALLAQAIAMAIDLLLKDDGKNAIAVLRAAADLADRLFSSGTEEAARHEQAALQGLMEGIARERASAVTTATMRRSP